MTAKDDWLRLLREEAKRRDVSYVQSDYAFKVGEDVAGKVHESKLQRRSKKDFIWVGVTDEIEYARSSDLEIVSVLLNVRSDWGFDPEVDTFISVPESILMQEARKRRREDRYDLEVKGAKRDIFESPFRRLTNNWDVLFKNGRLNQMTAYR